MTDMWLIWPRQLPDSLATINILKPTLPMSRRVFFPLASLQAHED
jgi:hypothetical protein